LLYQFDSIVSIVASRLAEEILSANEDADHQRPRILILFQGRFRGFGLEQLKECEDFQFVLAPDEIFGRFYARFYLPKEDSFAHWLVPTVTLHQMRYRRFLRKLLPKLYRALGVRLVLSPGFRYQILVDWGAVSVEIGVPYVVFHREGYAGSKSQNQRLISHGANGRKFEGSHLAVGVPRHRDLLIKGGFVTREKVSALGSMRMDKFLENIEAGNFQSDRNLKDQHVLMFSFGISPGFVLGGSGRLGIETPPLPPFWPRENREQYFLEACRSSHVAVARVAIEHPEINVIIKTKWDRYWRDEVIEFLTADDIFIDEVPNLSITSEGDVHALIEASRVVVGYGSTAMLEAAIAGKAVILPKFSEFVEERFQDVILYPDLDSCFEIAESAEDLEMKIYAKWLDPSIDQTKMNQRKRAFERYVSPLDRTATRRSLELIQRHL